MQDLVIKNVNTADYEGFNLNPFYDPEGEHNRLGRKNVYAWMCRGEWYRIYERSILSAFVFEKEIRNILTTKYENMSNFFQFS